MLRVLLLLVVLISLPGCETEDPPLVNTPENNFDIFWNDFDQNYSFFELKHIDWNSYYTNYRPRITPATTSSELSNILGEIILVLKDAHVWLSTGTKTISYSPLGNHPLNMPVNLNNYVVLQSAGAVLKHGIIHNQVGYLSIPSFSGKEADFTIAESILASWQEKNLKGIIIDLRGNGGGNEAYAMHVLKYFNDRSRIYSHVKLKNGKGHNNFTDWIDKTTPIHDKNYFLTLPVIVLTNRLVVSSAESMVMAMKTLPHVTIVGDTTAGASANPVTRRLPNGWTYTVSRWIQVTADYQVYENIGLYPDVAVWLKEEDTANGKDTIIEKALDLIGR